MFVYYNKGSKKVYILIDTDEVCDNDVFYPQREKGSTATAYEPNHASVSDSLAEKCDNSVIGTVEGANASKAWSVGEHFIKDGQFKEVTQPIANGGTISSSNTVDKPIADCLIKQATFSGTTSSTGVLHIDNSIDNTIIYAVISNRIATPFKVLTEGQYLGNWIRVISTSDGTPAVNVAVSGTYYYI